ncbi:MAG TPA: long-chain fatty acid--CoA ligase [Polyangiaceae bacterium]|nr:long-chain fatty acid--CoA ligase [Polyangiaceae bacterium]
MPEVYESLVDLFEKCSRRFATSELYGSKQQGRWAFITYAQFRTLVEAARGGLAKLGIGPGDRVAIIADNRLEWAVLAHATYSRGAIFVPMYESQAKEDLLFILKDSGAKLVVAANDRIYSMLTALKPDLPELQHLIGLALTKEDPASYDALLAAGQMQPTAPLFPAAADAAGFIYTSGTTGTPKGVVLSHGNICANVTAIQQLFDLHGDRSLAFLPWTHSFGQTAELHVLFSMGCSSAINDDVQNLLANLSEVRPTLLFAVPRIFNRIYESVHRQIEEKPKAIQNLFHSAIKNASKRAKGESLSLTERLGLAAADKLIFGKVRQKFGGRLRLVVSGSAALSPEVAHFIDALGINVFEGYGLTETSPIVSVNYPNHRKIGSVGKPLPGVRVTIRAVPEHTSSGEIVVYGPNVMQGYYRLPEETAQVLQPDGGFRTGDLGYLDSDGYLFITGRIKEQFKLETGKYVVPGPLEEELKLSPYVGNVLLFGANKPFTVALVVPNHDALKRWAAQAGVEPGQAAHDPRFKDLIDREVTAASKAFKSYERPRRVALLDQDFTVENGLMTPSQKIRRNAVIAKHSALLESLYAVA